MVENKPSFKLIKEDENGNRLPGVKFVIYNTDNGDKPATNSKGEILGVIFYNKRVNDMDKILADSFKIEPKKKKVKKIIIKTIK